jgi:quinol-cytochrome oxidoreductase complex cytochrome b subunit
MPLLVIRFIVVHLIVLHTFTSGFGRGASGGMEFTGFIFKDLLNILFFVLLAFLMVFIPNYFMDAENWDYLNPIVTPEHIKPE